MRILLANEEPASMDAILPPGRYFLGDPGVGLKPGMYEDLMTSMEGVCEAVACDDTLAMVVTFTARSGRSVYPETGPAALGGIGTDSGHIAMISERLCSEDASLWEGGTFVSFGHAVMCTVRDGRLRVEETSGSLMVQIDTAPDATRRALTGTLRCPLRAA